MKALGEIGFARIIRFFLSEVFLTFFNHALFPPIRILLLRLIGAKIGKNCIILDITLANLDRTGAKGLNIGNNCFIGNQVLFDLSGSIHIGNNVTIAARSLIMTHLNVGYRDHPLQQFYPKFTAATRVKSGSFIGAGSLLLPKVIVGRNSFVGAGSVVTKDVPDKVLVTGNPALIKRSLIRNK